MASTRTSFESRQAPCGQIVGGERYQHEDEEGLVIDSLRYACGCRSEVHEFHDGSVDQKIIHHNGTVLVDEINAER